MSSHPQGWSYVQETGASGCAFQRKLSTLVQTAKGNSVSNAQIPCQKAFMLPAHVPKKHALCKTWTHDFQIMRPTHCLLHQKWHLLVNAAFIEKKKFNGYCGTGNACFLMCCYQLALIQFSWINWCIAVGSSEQCWIIYSAVVKIVKNTQIHPVVSQVVTLWFTPQSVMSLCFITRAAWLWSCSQ